MIIDGAILNGRLEKLATDKSILTNQDLRLEPASIAAVSTVMGYTLYHGINIIYFRAMCILHTKTEVLLLSNLTVSMFYLSHDQYSNAFISSARTWEVVRSAGLYLE